MLAEKSVAYLRHIYTPYSKIENNPQKSSQF